MVSSLIITIIFKLISADLVRRVFRKSAFSNNLTISYTKIHSSKPILAELNSTTVDAFYVRADCDTLVLGSDLCEHAKLGFKYAEDWISQKIQS